jgi:hypothetical protein
MYTKNTLPWWLNSVETGVAMQRLPNDLSRSAVHQSALYLDLLTPYVTPTGRSESLILEFGSGWGEGLIALNAFSRAYGLGRVQGSEISAPRRATARSIATHLSLVDSNISPDGFAMLESYTNRAAVVVASTAGPSEEVSVERLVKSSLQALGEGGLFLVYSDPHTMEEVTNALDSAPFRAKQLVSGRGITRENRVVVNNPYCIVKNDVIM